jgi:hypothetical protein
MQEARALAERCGVEDVVAMPVSGGYGHGTCAGDCQAAQSADFDRENIRVLTDKLSTQAEAKSECAPVGSD